MKLIHSAKVFFLVSALVVSFVSCASTGGRGQFDLSNGPAQDEMKDFSLMVEHSANLYFDGSNSPALGDDVARLVRNTNTEEFVVYNVSGVKSMTVDTWFWSNEEVTDFAFFTGPDRYTWSSFAPEKLVIEGGWNNVIYTLSSMPIGTRYVKIQFKHDTTNKWNPQVGNIVLE